LEYCKFFRDLKTLFCGLTHWSVKN